MDIDKRALSERDICTKFITPALVRSGWTQDQIREEVTFTDGRIRVHGRSVTRDKPERADYVLYLKPKQPITLPLHDAATTGVGRRRVAVEHNAAMRHDKAMRKSDTTASGATGSCSLNPDGKPS